MSSEFPGMGGRDSYTTVTHTSWFSRLFGSFFSGLFGFVFFLASFVVLYMNEGLPDWSSLAKAAHEIDAAAPKGGEVGKFVAATGKLTSGARLGDAYLSEGNYVSLTRRAEMYAWDESETSRTEKKVGGGETKITEYNYEKKWTESPERSTSFKKQAGHFNPDMRLDGESWKADEASVGKLKVNMAKIELPSGKAVALTDAKTKGGDVSGGYLYLGDARGSSPRVGDVRLSYTALSPGGEVTLLGKLASPTAIAPYEMKEHKFYRLFEGDRADALKTMSSENQMRLWGLRLLGFFLCWGGMLMMLEPLNTVLDVLPFLGSMGRGLSGFMTFPIALILSGITIVVSLITHSLIAMVLIGVVVLIVSVKLIGGRKTATA